MADLHVSIDVLGYCTYECEKKKDQLEPMHHVCIEGIKRSLDNWLGCHLLQMDRKKFREGMGFSAVLLFII